MTNDSEAVIGCISLLIFIAIVGFGVFFGVRFVRYAWDTPTSQMVDDSSEAYNRMIEHFRGKNP